MALSILLAAAVALGGGGSPAPGSELLLQLIAAGIALALLIGPAAMHSLPRPSRTAWAVAGLALALPALQLIPLPPALWTALPGRALAEQALALVGQADAWRPWSLFPARTLAGLLAAVVPIIVLLAATRLDGRSQQFLFGVIGILALVSLAFGALQLAGGPSSPLRFFVQSNPGYLNGFQANRNSQADVLLVGMVALVAAGGAGLRERRNASARGLIAIGSLLLALGVLLTGSRSGIALLVPVAALAYYRLFGLPDRRVAAAAAVAAATAFAAYLAVGNRAIARVVERFYIEGDVRWGLWSDALYAIGTYWPFGSGIGSAGPVLAIVERLELVDPAAPNRVHNDFLELALETGVFGPLVLAAIVAILVRACVLRLRDSAAHNRANSFAALAILVILGLHSLVDYPLRSMAPACLAAFAAGVLLTRVGAGSEPTRDGGLE